MEKEKSSSSSSSSSPAKEETQQEEAHSHLVKDLTQKLQQVVVSSSSSSLLKDQHHSAATTTEKNGSSSSSSAIITGDDRCAANQKKPSSSSSSSLLLICDMGYGLPREARPRKEKLLAVSRQLVHFLHWQHHQASLQQQQQNNNKNNANAARILLVVPDTDIQDALWQRMQQVWQQLQQVVVSAADTTEFPKDIVSFTVKDLSTVILERQAYDDDDVVYLSPDADVALDPALPPPSTVIVGMLIDRRRIQVHRSTHRADRLHLCAKRWPLECINNDCCFDAGDDDDLLLHPNEPLNIDCVLEGMQQWHWNWQQHASGNNDDDDKTACFQKAAIQAIRHHQERHPERPRHLLHTQKKVIDA